MIAHLKDQLQETKAKTGMETKYIKKDAEVRSFENYCLLSKGCCRTWHFMLFQCRCS